MKLAAVSKCSAAVDGSGIDVAWVGDELASILASQSARSGACGGMEITHQSCRMGRRACCYPSPSARDAREVIGSALDAAYDGNRPSWPVG